MSVALKPTRRLDSTHALRITPQTVQRWMELYAESIRRSEQRLTELDGFIGDGDHGANMKRGLNAVVKMLGEVRPTQLSGQLRTISIALTSSVGGAAGPLYGSFFLQAAQTTAHKNEFTLADLTAMADAGRRGVVQLGKAEIGDKTMVDTLAAAVTALRASLARHDSIRVAVTNCREATRRAAVATTPMVARRGRASYLGERSAGYQDPGATSAALLFDALAEAVGQAPVPVPSHAKTPQPTLATL